MKICLIYNFAQHYRTDIFEALDNKLNIDFVFGDKYLDVKKMDYSSLQNSVKEVRNITFGPFMWQASTIKYAFKDYDAFILLGAYLCVTTWIIAIIARLRRKKVYFWTHGWYGNEGFIKTIIKKAYHSLATKNFLYGDYAKNLMIEQGFQPDRLVTIHNSLSYDKQVERRKMLSLNNLYQKHFGNNDPVVIFVGRLTPVKRLDILQKAQAICKDMRFNFNIVFIGEGQEKKKLEQYALEKELYERTWFYGACYDEAALSCLIYNADLCVAPGNIGLTAMHAMVYGCPCLTHNDFKWQMPEFESIVEGQTGAFFERGNVESLADSIIKWFEQQGHRREVVRQACFKEIDNNWNPHKQIEIIIQEIGA